MKAIILAAGRGSRMGGLTEAKPKCLVELAGQPLLAHALDGSLSALAVCEPVTDLMAAAQPAAAGLLVACGRTKEGVAAYEHALRLDPSLATAHSNLGVAYAEMGRVSEAIREFEAALRLEPGHPQARESLQLLKAGRP